jgi:radical SAM superfamily enzyme YgiQ (UPF0313 family)
LLKDLEDNKLKMFYNQTRPVDPKTIPFLKRNEQNRHKYFTSEKIQATRGCPYGCEFCAMTNRKYGRMFRQRPIENVIEEIKSTPHKIMAFLDSSLTTNPGYTKQLFREMKDLDKKFFCSGNVNVLNHDDELLKLANEAGCVTWCIGFESVSQKTIDLIGKKQTK